MGTSRMDAAIDAMKPLGFSRELVRTKMIHLLKEYGGMAGFPFIEADAYKVLIEAILADEEEARKQGETSMKDDSFGDDHATLATAGPSGENVEPKGSQTPNTATQNDCSAQGDESRWKDIVLDQTFSKDMRIVEAADSAGGYSSAAQQRASPTRRRPKPCYGWINDGEGDDDDDDDDDFVILAPAEGAFE